MVEGVKVAGAMVLAVVFGFVGLLVMYVLAAVPGLLLSLLGSLAQVQ